MSRARLPKIVVVTAIATLSALAQKAAETRRLTLTEAVHLAVSQNRVLKIARLKVIENEQKKAGERASYFPKNQLPPAATLVQVVRLANAAYLIEVEAIAILPPKA